MSAPTLLTFSTETELHDYVATLNDEGIDPQLGLVDSAGTQTLATQTAPGGDGWGFEYYTPNEDGFMHCCNCAECPPTECSYQSRGWKPMFPVYAMAPAKAAA